MTNKVKNPMIMVIFLILFGVLIFIIGTNIQLPYLTLVQSEYFAFMVFSAMVYFITRI